MFSALLVDAFPKVLWIFPNSHIPLHMMKDSAICPEEMSADSNLLTLNGINMGEYSPVVNIFASLSRGHRIGSQLVQYNIGRSKTSEYSETHLEQFTLEHFLLYDYRASTVHSEVYFGESAGFYGSVRCFVISNV
jgi:hypothetical protein